jgi:hypothetical protein
MAILPKINQLIGCFGSLQQSIESLQEATMKNESEKWGDNFIAIEATGVMKELIQLNGKIFSSITTDEEAALISKCLASLNNWKMATTDMLRKAMMDLFEVTHGKEIEQLRTKVPIAINC